MGKKDIGGRVFMAMTRKSMRGGVLKYRRPFTGGPGEVIRERGNPM